MAIPWKNSILVIDDGSGMQIPCHYQTNTTNIVDFVEAVNNLISLAQSNTSFSGTTTFENIHVTGTSNLDGSVTCGSNVSIAGDISIKNNLIKTDDNNDMIIRCANESYIKLNNSGGWEISNNYGDINNSKLYINTSDNSLNYDKNINIGGNLNVNGNINSPIKLPYTTITSTSSLTTISTPSGGNIKLPNNNSAIQLTTKSGKVFKVEDNGTVYIDNKQLLTKTEMMALEHPVGSVYITLTDTNPNIILGIGTWQKIGIGYKLGIVGALKDKNGVSHTTAAGANTDGEWSHANTVSEMAQHNHSATCSTIDPHTHARGTMNIKGTFSGVGQYYSDAPNTLTGAFYRVNTSNKPSQGARVSNASSAEKDDYFGFDASRNWTGETKENGKHSHTITIGNKGSGSKHNNIEPAFGIYLWKRTA